MPNHIYEKLKNHIRKKGTKHRGRGEGKMKINTRLKGKKQAESKTEPMICSTRGLCTFFCKGKSMLYWDVVRSLVGDLCLYGFSS